MVTKKYLIISCSDLSKVNFLNTSEDSEDTVRRSLDGSKCLIGWISANHVVLPPINPVGAYDPQSASLPEVVVYENVDPPFINDIESKEGPYTQEEILEILSGPEWSRQTNQSGGPE